MSELTRHLDELAATLAEVGVPVAARLRPGLKPDEVAFLAERLPVPFAGRAG